MTARYVRHAGWAWLEALDGGRRERIAWAANVETGEFLTFENTAWLIWVLLADGSADVDALRERAAAEGVGDALEQFDIAAFLEELEGFGVILRADNESDALDFPALARDRVRITRAHDR